MATGNTPNIFAGQYIDRRTESRNSKEWREAALADGSTLYVVSRSASLLVHVSGTTRIAFLDNSHPLVSSAQERQLVLLGWFKGARCMLLELGPDDAVNAPEGASFEDLRPIVAALDEESAALLAYARAISLWRVRTRFCGVCGTPTVPGSAGHVLVCSNPQCANEFFPRLDPAIIVLVSDGERALLGRQASWPPGRYSTLAGFVEPGESLEDAVAREVLEETGVRISNPRYRSSQPWPFPSSLMLGFHASAAPGSAIRLDGELEDARWFTREEINRGGVMPTSYSISHRLITEWLMDRGRHR